MKSYFQRVRELTPTRFWINNPTPMEAHLAIEAGAVGCTTNPTYAWKMFQNPETHDYICTLIDRAISSGADNQEAASQVQAALVEDLMKIFSPVYEQSGGSAGFVSLQSNPHRDEDVDFIVKEALNFAQMGSNYIAKIPATQAGLEASRAVLASHIPVIITEVMSVSQTIASMEVLSSIPSPPPCFITHITGIFDQYIQGVVKEQGLDISSDVLRHAGLAAAKKQYQIMNEFGTSAVMLGGGARDLHHFTDFVGGDLHITINWKNTADRLIEEETPVSCIFTAPPTQRFCDTLFEALPDMRKACFPWELSIHEFQDYGPVQLFRSMFVDGWDRLTDVINTCRKEKM